MELPIKSSTDRSSGQDNSPIVSVIILNYNGLRWVERCLESLKAQTIFSLVEVIVADNLSKDGSDIAFKNAMAGLNNCRFIQNGSNLGFCEGNNRPAKTAKGKYLFFLNNDTWLEADCLETLVREVEAANAQAGTPIMLNYEDYSLQSAGGGGFDIFGFLTQADEPSQTQEIFVVGGCSYLITKELFDQLGGFDAKFFMYADEYDLSWRVWAAGAKAVVVPSARLHHRGAAIVNPKGEQAVVEICTSQTKRFYSNRNNLLVVLKNCQHLLLLIVPLQLALLCAEALVSLFLVRSLRFVMKAYWSALVDCWRLRGYIFQERRRFSKLRRRSDFWMLRFLTCRLNRLDELKRMRHLGLPKVSCS